MDEQYWHLVSTDESDLFPVGIIFKIIIKMNKIVIHNHKDIYSRRCKCSVILKFSVDIIFVSKQSF